jgi:hypothetical protein
MTLYWSSFVHIPDGFDGWTKLIVPPGPGRDSDTAMNPVENMELCLILHS